MSEERLIQKVTDNKEKWGSYKTNMRQYNKAKKSEFYYECLWILYAMIEDRIAAFLYYMGFTAESDRSGTVTPTRKIRKEIRTILAMEPAEKYNFNPIFRKIAYIRKVSEWSHAAEDRELSAYQKTLLKAIQKVESDPEFEKTLCYLEHEWKDKRNQLTHALFNKNPEAVRAELRPMVEKGYTVARELDKAVRKMKKENIRSKFRIK